jgi:alpha-tubulin suppressor-like RCC1 family protein/HEAT repeat protein
MNPFGNLKLRGLAAAGCALALIPAAPALAGQAGARPAPPRVSAGSGHCQTVRPGGAVWGWGMILSGNLAEGSSGGHKNAIKEPLQAKGPGGEGKLADMLDISCSVATTCALRADGTVWCWGSGGDGQMGNGSASSSALPVQVKSPDGKGFFTDAVAVAAGHTHCIALRKDGTVWVWGLNDRGQLGNGSKVEKSALPVQVRTPDGKGSLDDATGIAAGVGHCLALRKDGTVLAWGENVVGQVGDGTTTDRFLPVKVDVPEEVVSVGAGWHFSFAVCKDGSLWGWGYNIFGQLGDGTVYDRHRPVRTKGADGKAPLTGVARAVGGSLHALLIMKDGTLWGLGGNSFGQLGTGKRGEREPLPVQVKGPGEKGFLEGVVDADGGSVHSTAVTADGTVYCWGDNYRHQIGDPAVPVGGWVMNGAYVDGAKVKAESLYKKGAMSVPGPPFPWPARLPSARAAGLLEALEKLGPESKGKVPEVTGHLDDGDVLVRIAAVRTLARMGGAVSGVVPGLAKALGDADRSVRMEAVKALSKCKPGEEGVVPALIEVLTDEDSAVAEAACKALGNFGPPAAEAVPAMWAAVRKGGAVGSQAIDMLGLMGEAAVPVLVEGLEDKDNPRLRMGCVLALGNIGPKAAAAVPALVKVLGCEDRKTRQHTGRTLGSIGPAAKEAIPALKKLLENQDEHKSVRHNAQWALEQIGGK